MRPRQGTDKRGDEGRGAQSLEIGVDLHDPNVGPMRAGQSDRGAGQLMQIFGEKADVCHNPPLRQAAKIYVVELEGISPLAEREGLRESGSWHEQAGERRRAEAAKGATILRWKV